MSKEPSIDTLLRAVATFLTDSVRPALTDNRLRFQALIAADLLGKVGGQLTLSRAPSADDALAAAIRAGELTAAQRDSARTALLGRMAAALNATSPSFNTAMDLGDD